MKKLEELSDKHNFSMRQTEMLYKLCEMDLDKLDLLLCVVNKSFKGVPSTKQEVAMFLTPTQKDSI